MQSCRTALIFWTRETETAAFRQRAVALKDKGGEPISNTKESALAHVRRSVFNGL